MFAYVVCIKYVARGLRGKSIIAFLAQKHIYAALALALELALYTLKPVCGMAGTHFTDIAYTSTRTLGDTYML